MTPDWLKFLAEANRRDIIELELWRKYYRHRAPYIAEEAAAKAENRAPNYLPPIAIG
jgi:hypothetical protein